MSPDDEVCYCFHVTRRKLVNFTRRARPQVPSQLSECGGAGTGCGWCIPFLRLIFRQESGELDGLSAEDYARRRADYVREGGGTPPPGATPLPPDDAPGVTPPI
jgi:NAD(P)H-nitrite reductase large subunit